MVAAPDVEKLRRAIAAFDPLFGGAPIVDLRAACEETAPERWGDGPVIFEGYWPVRRNADARQLLARTLAARPTMLLLRATVEGLSPLRLLARLGAPSLAARVGEPLPFALRDVAAALPPGAAITARDGDLLRLGDGPAVAVEPPFRVSLLRDGDAALHALRRAEGLLQAGLPLPSTIARARAEGATAVRRSAEARLGFREVLTVVDGILSGKSGCLRRTIAEVLGDADAAAEPIHLGLDVGATGHAWLAGDRSARRYDVAFTV